MEALVTGATGLVGHHILKHLLNQGNYNKIHLLVRDVARANVLLKPLIGTSQQVQLHEGDLTKENLGLNPSSENVVKTADQVYHCAANVSLSSSKETKEAVVKTNTYGTKNLLELIKDNKKVLLFYISTGYAAGVSDTTTPEDWLPKPTRFRNPYEESKWDAEMLIKEYHETYGTNYLILRPTIILTDHSEDAQRIKNQTVYLYTRIVKQIIDLSDEGRTNIKILGRLESQLNFVKIDLLIQLIDNIKKLSITNKIFNVANPEPISAKVITDTLQECLQKKVVFDFQTTLPEEDLTSTERRILKVTGAFSKYLLEQSNTWDVNNTLKIVSDNSDYVTIAWIKDHLKQYLMDVKL